MQRLLVQARELLGCARLDGLECKGYCGDCAIKRVEHFELMLDDWDARLAQGAQPSLGDLDELARFGRALAGMLIRARLLCETDLPWRLGASASPNHDE